MILSPDKQLRIDPVVENILNKIDTSIPLIPITRLDDFVFNDDLLNLDKYVVVDFVEVGWAWDMATTHLFGRNTQEFGYLFNSDEWKKFDDFVRDRQPALYFKRELLSKDVSKNIRPIEYPGLHEVPNPDTKEQFNERLFQAFNAWGLSHEGRKKIHGDIWQKAGQYGYVVCDNISTLDAFVKHENNQKKWITQNTAWYARYDMKDILQVSSMSKISCSWGGAGRKCFRHTETINSTMIMWGDGIEWTYPFIDNVNCIKCNEGEEVERIIEALNNPYLYEIYLAGVATQQKYYIPNYIKYYLQPLINNL